MFEIITIDKNYLWDEIVCSFPNYDVYYLSGYLKGFQLHNDGVPILIYYNTSNLRAVCALFKRSIQDSDYWDVITPYGYGGFIFDRNVASVDLTEFKIQFYQTMQEHNIVSAFMRYHPLLDNADCVRSIFEIVDLGKTIDLDLSSLELIDKNLISKNRNMIRKAQKNGITIFKGKGLDLFDKFIPIYNATMARDNSLPYYYFGLDFYASIDRDMKDNYEIFYAVYEDKIIAMSIILFANKYVHYHLSGSLFEYRHLAPTNLLLYEVAKWGQANGYEKFHLGGGVGSGEDNLYKFKSSFNRNSANQFSISKLIFDQAKYDDLVEKRKDKDIHFNDKSTFFPLYRA